MKACKVRPSYFQCGACLDWQMRNSMVALCDQCELANVVYDLMYMTDDYAVIMNEQGSLIRVEVERVYDIKEED